jgi:MFS family permease
MIQRVNTLPVRLTLLMISTLTVMAGATIAPSLPAMQQFFETAENVEQIENVEYWVRLVITAPALFIAIGAPVVGVLIDRLGRKPLLAVALVLYGLAGSSGLWLDAIGLILVGRAFLGMSVAGIMVTATALIADYYTGPARGQFLGLQAAFMSLGGVVFLSIGGFLADVNWRMPFALYLVALMLAPCVLLFLPEPQRMVAESPAAGNDRDSATPFPTRLVALTYGIAILTQIIFYTIPVQLPFYLQTLVKATAFQSGLAIALCSLFSAVTSLLYQRIKARLNFVNIYGIAFLNIALGYGLLSLAQGYGLIIPGLVIAGLGLGLLMPNMNFCLTSVTPGAARGKVLGGLTTSFFLGQFTSPLLSQPLSTSIGIGNTYGLAGVVMGLFTIATFILLARWK